MNTRKIKNNILCRVLRFLVVTGLIAYIFSMFFVPWCYGDWVYVQKVWNNWQSLNAGMLAFISSLIAFNISRNNSENQRKRDFIASRAELPHTLSELSEYLEQTVDKLKLLHNSKENWNDIECITFKSSHIEVFKGCIRYAEPAVGDYLANILNKLQVHHSRLKGLYSKTAKRCGNKHYIQTNLCFAA